MLSKSAEYYRTHPAAMAGKAAYDTKFESSPAKKAKRRQFVLHWFTFTSGYGLIDKYRFINDGIK